MNNPRSASYHASIATTPDRLVRKPSLEHRLLHRDRCQTRLEGYQAAILVMAVGLASLLLTGGVQAADDWLQFEPVGGGKDAKHVVLIAGDEEYRSEESMPMLAKLLSQKHGFRATVLFSFGPDDAEYIDANNQSGLRGLESLADADLMIIGTRFRRPSEEQAESITEFLNAGKPVIGIRTATHAFQGRGNFGETISYSQFGRLVLGEQWVRHHGAHKVQGTRSEAVAAHAKHPILRGVGSFFAPSDVYGVIHLTEADTILLRGLVTESLDPKSAVVSGKPNDPAQPLAWLHGYESPDGTTTGQAFCTTAGASVDFVDPNLRRLIVNAAYFLTDREVPRQADVEFVDPFYPSFYGFIRDKEYWRELNRKPGDYRLGKSPVAPDPPGSPDWPHRPRPLTP